MPVLEKPLILVTVHAKENSSQEMFPCVMIFSSDESRIQKEFWTRNGHLVDIRPATEEEILQRERGAKFAADFLREHPLDEVSLPFSVPQLSGVIWPQVISELVRKCHIDAI